MSANARAGAPRAAALLTAIVLFVHFGAVRAPESAACPTPHLDWARDGVATATCSAEPGATSGEVPMEAARLLFGRGLDPNRAAPGALEALPGIGPARALAIVREARVRPFCRAEDLERVAGIGPAIQARLAAFVEVSPGACAE